MWGEVGSHFPEFPMLRDWKMDVRPKQLEGLRQWPPPPDNGQRGHNHAIDPGVRCYSQILRYKSTAECPGCGRFWKQPPLPPRVYPGRLLKLIKSDIEIVEIAIVTLLEQKKAVIDQLKLARERKKSLLSEAEKLNGV